MDENNEGFRKLNFINDFKKVIVVENIQFVAASLTKVLKEAGFFVFHSSTGKSALYLTQNYAPDVVIVSEKLPDIIGFNLIRELKSINECIKVIYISSKDDFKYKQESVLAGSDYYLLKPFERTTIINAVNEVLYGGLK